MGKASHAVVIGRFQPFHVAHQALINKALELADKVIVVIGSAYAARSAKNPFTFEERRRMIYESFDRSTSERLECIGVSDFFYNENRWFDTVRIKVAAHLSSNSSVILVGHKKDHSSYYVSRFQGWSFREVGTYAGGLNATDLRRQLFTDDIEDGSLHNSHYPLGTQLVISEFINLPAYDDIRAEWQHIDDYKRAWEVAPYPPVFVTTDAVIHKTGYILLIKRRQAPGKGLWALPGGFVEQHETLLESCLRETAEESGLSILPGILQGYVRESRTFDYPYRSLRGRTITHAFLIDLGEGMLPPLRAGDDAAEAKWFTTAELFNMQDQMFEDHYSIVHYFTSKL